MNKPIPPQLARSMVFAGVTIVASVAAYVVDLELVCGLVVLVGYRVFIEGR